MKRAHTVSPGIKFYPFRLMVCVTSKSQVNGTLPSLEMRDHTRTDLVRALQAPPREVASHLRSQMGQRNAPIEHFRVRSRSHGAGAMRKTDIL
jgi:hypothetical protein